MRVNTSTLRIPRYVGGRVQSIPTRLPPGWQQVSIRVPMRPASCEETDCPMFLGGWTEVVLPDGTRHPRAGRVTQDEAAETFGRYGPAQLVPRTIEHPPGTPCPRIHKVPSGIPPVYQVDGRTVYWPEFEDSLAGGVETARRIRQQG